MEFNVDVFLAWLKNRVSHQGMSSKRTTVLIQGKDFYNGKKRSKYFGQESLSTFIKKKKKTMDEPTLSLEPLNVFELSPPSLG